MHFPFGFRRPYIIWTQASGVGKSIDYAHMRCVMYTEDWEREDLGDKKWKEAGHTDGKKSIALFQ